MGSIKSGCSAKSTQSYGSEFRKSVCLSKECLSMSFDECVLRALAQFECPIHVVIFKETQRGLNLKRSVKSDTKHKEKNVTKILGETSEGSPVVSVKHPSQNQPVLPLLTCYDSSNQLLEIRMIRYNCRPVPRILMQVLALITPHIRHLSRFTIKECCIDMYTVYELKKMLPMTNITDICLDQSPLEEGNYDILLSELSCLQNLSLARCYINDDVCCRLAAKLIYLQPGESKLLALNLSSNNITNEGAKYLAEALRTNRHLRYLNLADNHIENDGATYIFNVLKEFPLTFDEIIEKRKRYLNYLKVRTDAYSKCMHQLLMKSESCISIKKHHKGSSKKSKLCIRRDHRKGSDISISSSKYRSTVNLAKEASVMTQELVGCFEDPFAITRKKPKNDDVFCKGNFILCYLNLSYNKLTNRITKLLLDVIQYQEKFRSDKLSGLIKILLDGNYISAECGNLKIISERLKVYIEKKAAAEKRRTLLH